MADSSHPAPEPAADTSVPRDLAWFLARTPPATEPPPRTAGEWNRRSVAAFIANHSPKETPMSDPKPTPRTVVWESDVCAGVISDRSCEDCDDEACEHECHDTEETPDV